MSVWWSSLVLESPSPVPLFWYFHFCYYPNENCVWFRCFLHNLERNHKKKIMFLKFLYVRLVKFSSTPPSPYFDIFIFVTIPTKIVCDSEVSYTIWKETIKKKLCSWNFSMSNWWSSLVLVGSTRELHQMDRELFLI